MRKTAIYSIQKPTTYWSHEQNGSLGGNRYMRIVLGGVLGASHAESEFKNFIRSTRGMILCARHATNTTANTLRNS